MSYEQSQKWIADRHRERAEARARDLRFQENQRLAQETLQGITIDDLNDEPNPETLRRNEYDLQKIDEYFQSGMFHASDVGYTRTVGLNVLNRWIIDNTPQQREAFRYTAQEYNYRCLFAPYNLRPVHSQITVVIFFIENPDVYQQWFNLPIAQHLDRYR